MSEIKQMERFEFELPERESLHKGKGHRRLARTDLVRAEIQVVYEGGETNLHSHSGNDGFWYVLGGSAIFYSDEDTIFAELGPNEGVLVPRGTPYWFKKGEGDEPLQIMHVAAQAQDTKDTRTNYNARTEREVTVEL